MHIVRFLVVGFLLSLFIFLPSKAFAFSGSGNGTGGNPYQITTCSQLHETVNNLSAYYLLKNDVDCTGFSFTPIGDITSNFFVGQLDGGGHKITNLTITSDENSVGIFEQLGSGAVITNIGYESGSITGGEDTTSIGSFAGKSSGGSITKSYSKVNLDGTAAAGIVDPTMGGLLGQGNSVTISDSYYSGNITNGTVGGNYTAGIAGYLSSGNITRSYSTGILSNGQDVGGLVGRLLSSSTISDSFSTMTFSNDSIVGGLVGLLSSGTISNSYFNDTIGGLFGMQCYFGGNTGCTAVVKNIPYFYTVTNPPMDGWDFINTWSTINNGTNYPLLYWQSPNPTSTPTPAPSNNNVSGSASAPRCGDAAPTNSPNLFQVISKGNTATLYFVPVSGPNNKYYISYGLNDSASGFGVEFNYLDRSGVIPYTINYLFPGTWYFKVRGGNGCMPGNWSSVMPVKVGLGTNTNRVDTTVLGASTVATPHGTCTNYTVQAGDSLWGIATSQLGNGMLLDTIKKQNNLSSSLLHVGQNLKIGC